MRVSFNSEVAANAAKAARNARINFNPRDGENRFAESGRIESLRDRISQIRERIYEINTDPNLSSETKANMVKELTESIYALELDIEYLSHELRRKIEEEQEHNGLLSDKNNAKNYDTYTEEKRAERYQKYVGVTEGVMARFLEEKEAEAAARTEKLAQSEQKQEKPDESLEKNTLLEYNAGSSAAPSSLEDISAAGAGLDKAETILQSTRRLERETELREAAFLKSGNRAHIDSILKAKTQIRINRTNPLNGLK
ncbi:MAG: hypothetical protein FWE74_00200 [Oscillospiraceae bacterium]|nr:hypothetical protein [Oscillospiraceae bacterium]